MKSQIPRMTRQELYGLIEEALAALTNMDRVPPQIYRQFAPHLLSVIDHQAAYIAAYIVDHAKGSEERVPPEHQPPFHGDAANFFNG